MFGSRRTASRTTRSHRYGLPSWFTNWFSTNSSPMMPVSRAYRWVPWAVALQTHTRISLLELPPRTGRFCTSATRRPKRAAAMAAHTPESPPPITVTSLAIDSCRIVSPHLRGAPVESRSTRRGWMSGRAGGSDPSMVCNRCVAASRPIDPTG